MNVYAGPTRLIEHLQWPYRLYSTLTVCVTVELLVERGWVTLSANFRGRGSSTNDFWRQKTGVPGLSRGVVCVILRLAVLIQYRRMTHTETHGHTIMANTSA